MITFTKTRSAADYISRHTTSDLARSRALVLLKRLRVCEAALTATDGDPSLAHSLLRGLVLTVRELAGPAWLAANTDDPDIAAFIALASALTPPTPGRPRRTPRPCAMGPLRTRGPFTVASQASRRGPAHCQPMTTGGRATTRPPHDARPTLARRQVQPSPAPTRCLAFMTGAQIAQEPSSPGWPGCGHPGRPVLEHAAPADVRAYAKRAREAGMSWQRVREAGRGRTRAAGGAAWLRAAFEQQVEQPGFLNGQPGAFQWTRPHQ
jgi:hypothetical protein